MREQNGKRITIASPKQNIFILPSISPTFGNKSRNLQPEFHNRSAKISKYNKNKIASLDKICLRECCRRKNEVLKINAAHVIAKKQYFMAINKGSNPTCFENKFHRYSKNETVSKPKKRVLTCQGEILPKDKLHSLDNLKQFNPQDILQKCDVEMNERQTKHKVNTNQTCIKLIEWKESFKKINKSSKKIYKNKEQYQDKHETQNYKQYIENSNIYNKQVTSITNHKQVTRGSSQKGDARINPTQIYYRYIENYQNSKNDDSENFRKAPNSQYDQQISQESFFKSQIRKENSTIFHSNKLKFSSSLKHSHIKSSKLLSKDYQFKIPKTQQQQTQFLLNYKPLDPDFNLKSIVGKQNFKISAKDNIVYFGLVEGEQKNGLGIIISQKQIFEGEFISDQKFKGIQKTKQGTYIGRFIKGMREGKAKFIWKNGEQFEGQWKNGKKDGPGIWKSPKGDYYEGGWKNNKQNGKGLFVHVGGSTYKGQFKNFLKHGKGQQEFANGDKYIGLYKDGKPHGLGKYLWCNGDIYKGQFIQGSRQGKGILIKSDSENYEGYFANDMKHGQGIQLYTNGDYFKGFFEQDVKIKGKLFNKKGILLSQLT